MNQLRRKFGIIFTMAVCLLYLFYRGGFTLNMTSPYAIAASLILFVSECVCIFLLGLYFFEIWEIPKIPPPGDPPPGATVDVFVPTYNEDAVLLRATITACLQMEYPHRTYLLDDGRREEIRLLAEELGVQYMTRSDNRHAKAGNLNNALEQTDGDFIVILDADHVPSLNFLTRLLGYFKDDRLGFIQTPHAFYNFESFLASFDPKRKRYWEEGHIFYSVVESGKNFWNAVVFAGSAAMIRRAALKEVGFIATETITEDIHTGLRMASRGWKSLYINERLVAGQAAADVTTFYSQRLRWGEGNFSVIFYDNPLTMRGLKPGQRVSYFASMIGWIGGLPRLCIYLTPILMLFTDIAPVARFTWELLIVTLAYLLTTSFGLRYITGHQASIYHIELSNMANFWTQIRGVWRAMFKRRLQKFVVTSKRGRQSKSVLRFVMPHIYFIALSVASIAWAAMRLGFGFAHDYVAEGVALIMVLIYMFLAAKVVHRALQIDNQRFHYRHPAHVSVRYTYKQAEKTCQGYGITADLNESGMRLISFEKLPTRTDARFDLQAAGYTISCEGRLLYQATESKAKRDGGDVCYAYGVSFNELTPQQVDTIAMVTLQYAVPMTYARVGSWRSAPSRFIDWWTRDWKRLTKRHEMILPIIIDASETSTPSPVPMATVAVGGLRSDGSDEDSVELSSELLLPVAQRTETAVTQDVSVVACRTVLKQTINEQEEIAFRINSPMGMIAGVGRIIRRVPTPMPMGSLWTYVIQFLRFQEQGRGRLASLLDPILASRLRDSLWAGFKPPPSPVAKPLAVAALIFFLAFPVQFGLFRWLNNDFFVLSSIADNKVITAAEQSQIDSIYDTTLRTPYPDGNKLVMLRDLYARLRDFSKVNKITQVLVERYPHDLGLQMALADSELEIGDIARAEKRFSVMLGLLDETGVDPEMRARIMLAAARCSVRAKKYGQAIERFEKLMQMIPFDMQLRNEFAGVLVAAGRMAEAEQLYRGITLDDKAQETLAAIYQNEHRWRQAEDQLRTILEGRPEDNSARLELARIMSWQGDYRESLAIYRDLLEAKPDDLTLRSELAQVTLWSKDYQAALDLYQGLLDRGLYEKEIMQGYLDAAAMVPQLPKQTQAITDDIYDRMRAVPSRDARLLAQLAWVLQRLGEPQKGVEMLQDAVKLSPDNVEMRLQYANLLHDLGHFQQAEQEYNHLLTQMGDSMQGAAFPTPN